MITLSNTQKQILNGHLLGDGNITLSRTSKNAFFCIDRSSTDKNYTLWSASYFEHFLTPNGVKEYQRVRSTKTSKFIGFRTKCLPIFTEYYHKWYPEGKKIVPKDLILTPLTIAVWFADDGCVINRQNTQLRVKFSTEGFSYQDVCLLKTQLNDLFGDRIRIEKIKDKEQFVIAITHSQTSKKLLYTINEYITLPERKRKTIEVVKNMENSILKSKQNCVHCNSKNTVKNGLWPNKKQIYKCKTCNKSFTI